MPAGEAPDRGELVRPPGAPKRDHRVLPVENPAQGKMDDAPSIVCLREPVEHLDRSQVLRKPGSSELGVGLSQVIPNKLRLRRHAAREQTPAQRAVGKRDDISVPAIGEDVAFDGALEEIVWRLHRLDRRNLAKSFDLRGTEIADADHSNLAG